MPLLEFAPYLDQLEQEIAHTKRILDIINTALAMRASPDCIARRLSQLNLKTPDYLVRARLCKDESGICASPTGPWLTMQVKQ